MATPTIPNGEEYFFPIIYEGNGRGQKVGRFVPFTDSGTIANSCLFENNVSSYLSRTLSSNGSGTTVTFSCWVKRDILSQGAIGSVIMMHSDVSANSEILEFNSTDNLHYYEVTSGTRKWNFATVRTFEDTSKWYHIMVARNTTEDNTDDRVKIYVDGELLTDSDFQDGSGALDLIKPAKNDTGYWNQTTYDAVVGNTNNGSYIDGAGYLAEVNMVDGTALGPETFGVTDTSTGRWIPKTLSGITYGTNGFRLTFQNNSAAANLGYDYQTSDRSGTTNDFTVTNLATTNQTTDSPTQNFAVIGENGFSSLSKGNLKAEGSVSGQWRSGVSSLGMKSGKYYWEVKIVAHSNDNFFMFGICNESTISYVTAAANRYPGLDTNSGSYSWQPNAAGNDDIRFNGSIVREETGTPLANDNILQFAYDADTDRLWVGKDDTFLYSGDPANGTNYTISGIGTSETRYPALTIHNDTSHKFEVNFGQKSFAYTPPTGFVALQQDNLPETAKGISGLVWTKNRDSTDNHQLYDSSRGKQKVILPDTTTAESTVTDGLQKFLAGGQQIEDNVAINTSGESYVSWNWVANGGTTASNTDGSITSTTQVNSDAGFSIVEFTTPSSTQDFTVGHGLSVAPRVFFFKRTDSTSGWAFYHQDLFDTYGNQYTLFLNTSGASYAPNPGTAMYPSATTATTFSLRAGASIASSANCVAYCFNEVEGFSKFGKYSANNSEDGPFVYLGFTPSVLLIKSNSAISWYIMDATRNTFNPVINGNTIDNPQAEFTNQFKVDFLSNGFKIRNDSSVYGGSTNNSSYSPYYYMAFAKCPFANISPATAR